MRKIICTIVIAFTAASCHYKLDLNAASNQEEQIREAEKNFEKTVKEKGIAEGFYQFADDNATIKTDNDTLIHGKENIKKHFSNPKYLKAKVSWTPDFISVSKDGTLGYDFGKYIWTVTDSLGKAKEYTGVFHTVWKKQADGSWKYVWD